MYRASDELIQILLKNGFRNKSYQYVKAYGERFASKRPYKPHSYKREFGFGDGKMLGFYFNYINMAVTERSHYITGEHSELTEDQLRSIIAYFKCSYSQRRAIRGYTGNRIELSGQIMKEERELDLFEKPFDKSFESLYYSITL